MWEVDNREENDYRLNTQWFLYEDEQEWIKEETGTLSKEEAVKQADEIKISWEWKTGNMRIIKHRKQKVYKCNGNLPHRFRKYYGISGTAD